MVEKKVNILIIGAGKCGTALVESFSKIETIDILGVIDTNADAPGIKMAKEQGIPTASDYKEFIVKKDLDEIINVTGDEKVQEELLNAKPSGVRVLDAYSVKLFWELVKNCKKAEENLKLAAGHTTAEKLKMESMVESISEGVIMIDKSGEIVVLNPQAREMLGFEADARITSNALKKKIRKINLDEPFKKSRNKGRLVTKDITVPSGEGSIILHSEITPVKNAKGKIIGIVIILIDLTREKEIDRMKTEFISTVSHELRTPLSITKEGVSLVLDKIPGKINEKQEQILSTAKDNIDRLARIINNLLDISKIEAGKVELKRRVIDVVGLVNKIANSFEPKVKERGLKLKTKFPEGKIEIYADADKITQVFTNLIGNAMKFTEKGHMEISCVQKEKEVVCAVADTGVGLAKDDLPKVFNKFQQFGRIAGAGEKGTGLGLSIAKSIVEMHNGKISVNSKLGVGTKFTFTIPKYKKMKKN